MASPAFSTPLRLAHMPKIALLPATTLCFERLKETFMVDVARAEGRALNVALISPFRIASSSLEEVGNVAVRVELRNGCVGWGEAPVLPRVTAEDQAAALGGAALACDALVAAPPASLDEALERISGVLPGHSFASVRAGVEMALIDAVANSIAVPLWKLFGGSSNSLTTDITIPIVSPHEAGALASSYREKGFNKIKLKVGKDLCTDIQVLKAIRVAHPHCSLLLDANEGYTISEAITFLERLHEMGIRPELFEQPVDKEDWEGLHHISNFAKGRYGISVVADESCRSLEDAYRIINGNLAHVINIKLAKLGVVESLKIIEVARWAGIGLMIGGMVETRLAMGFSGHLAAGLGCFRSIDLDTPLLMKEDPVIGGYEVFGPVYKFRNARGHGGFLHWDNIH